MGFKDSEVFDFVGESISLKEEGELFIGKKPLDKSPEELELEEEDVFFVHSCAGYMIFNKISDKKNVLFCHLCGLRLFVPVKVKNKKQLKNFLEK